MKWGEKSGFSPSVTETTFIYLLLSFEENKALGFTTLSRIFHLNRADH